jgi:hypothetical protein
MFHLIGMGFAKLMSNRIGEPLIFESGASSSCGRVGGDAHCDDYVADETGAIWRFDAAGGLCLVADNSARRSC